MQPFLQWKSNNNYVLCVYVCVCGLRYLACNVGVCAFVWVCVCVCVCVFVCVGFVMCGCFGNTYTVTSLRFSYPD